MKGIVSNQIQTHLLHQESPQFGTQSLKFIELINEFLQPFWKPIIDVTKIQSSQILLKNGNFTENVKTDCRRRLQTPMQSGPGESSHRNRYLK